MTRRRRVRLTVLGLVLTASVALAGAPAQAALTTAAEPAATGTRSDLQRELDEVVRSGASAALAEVRDERGVARGASGIERMGARVPAPVDGRFRAGSITKTFVATVVLQLAAEGRLGLDDPVEKWLPGTVPNGGNITLRQLLNHTSGIFNYTEALPLATEEFLPVRFRTYTPQQLVGLATARPPYFPPGTDWRYSNTNYILAGLVVEKVTGRPYAEAVRQRILRPLGLRHTYLPGRSFDIAGPHAHGHLPVVRGGEVRWVDVSRLNPTWAWAAGEIISTTADLNRFYTALLGGRLLPPAQLAAMKTTVEVEPGFRYGLGLASLDLPCGGTAWGHDGGIHGYATFSLHTADGGRHVTLSVNPVLPEVGAGINALLLAELCPASTTTERTGATTDRLFPSYRGVL